MTAVLTFQHLASKPAVLKGTHAETDLDAVVSHIQPPVREVELKHLWFIEERIAIHVMRSDIARNMTENDSAPFIPHLQG